MKHHYLKPPRTLVNLGLTELTIQQKNRGNANHDLQTNIHCAFQKAGLESERIRYKTLVFITA